MAITHDDVSRALLTARWVFAKTMAHNPHEWTQRKDWKAPVSFDDAVIYIREHGYQMTFGRRAYTCLDVGPHRYWTMGSPLSDTWIINRAIGSGRR